MHIVKQIREPPYKRNCYICGCEFRTYSHNRVVRCKQIRCQSAEIIRGKGKPEPDDLTNKEYRKAMQTVRALSDEQQNALYEEARKKLMKEEV